MNLNNLEEILKDEPAYRVKQIKQLVFKNLIADWKEDATTLPKDLRQKLAEKMPLSINGKIFVSKDNETAKTLITLIDNFKIESVLMRHKDGRNTICVSSQVGCPLRCSFCATGKIGFRRNLESWEIIEQVIFFARHLALKKEKITNIVFMGMGEPFLNYDNVLAAIKTLNDGEGFGLGARHFSISTVGITEGILRLAREKIAVNLAISLHAPDDESRSKIMPVNNKYSIKKIMDAVNIYVSETHRRVMFEYIMIKNINDSYEYAGKLSKLMTNTAYFVNLISYNPTGLFKPSQGERIKKFKEILEKNQINVTQRYRFGGDIDAACGQLAGKANSVRTS